MGFSAHFPHIVYNITQTDRHNTQNTLSAVSHLSSQFQWLPGIRQGQEAQNLHLQARFRQPGKGNLSHQVCQRHLPRRTHDLPSVHVPGEAPTTTHLWPTCTVENNRNSEIWNTHSRRPFLKQAGEYFKSLITSYHSEMSCLKKTQFGTCSDHPIFFREWTSITVLRYFRTLSHLQYQ